MSQARVSLRAATSADAPGIADVYLASRKAFLSFAPLAHPDDEVRRWIATTLVPAGNVVVAEEAARVVGMVATSAADGVSWIDHLYLHPELTGRGIGTQLLARALEGLPPPVRLYTFQANTGARRFYERHGFRAISFGDGSGNEEGCPDVLYGLSAHRG